MVRNRLVRALLIGVVAAGTLGLVACGGTDSTPRGSWHSPAAAGGSGGGTGEVIAAQAVTSSASPTASTGSIMKMTGGTNVALTFDDGPSAYTPQILTLLRQHGVKATFCLVGVEVKARPDLVRAIVADGHTLCNHTWNHDLNLGRKSPDVIRADLQRTLDEIHGAVPNVPIRYFRHPGGNFTPAAISVAAELGMRSAGWDVDTRDWDIRSHPVGPPMTENILALVRQHTRPGSIVLAHDAGGDRTSTIVAFRTLLPELKAEYTLAALPTE